MLLQDVYWPALSMTACLQATKSGSPSASTSTRSGPPALIVVPWHERLWYGYDVYSTWNRNPAETVTEQYKERFLGSKGSNRLLTGLFVQQVRQLYSWEGVWLEDIIHKLAHVSKFSLQERFVLKCQGHFGGLGYACQDQQFAYLSQCEAEAGPDCLLLSHACLLAINKKFIDAASANRTGSTASSPFGYDPVFGTYSSLWNVQLVGQEGSFYNLTAVRALSILPFLALGMHNVPVWSCFSSPLCRVLERQTSLAIPLVSWMRRCLVPLSTSLHCLQQRCHQIAVQMCCNSFW